MSTLRRTTIARHLTVIRVLCAIPLLGIGTQHLIGTAPMGPILVGAGIPFATPLALIVPVLEVLAGLALVIGYEARLAALASLVTMVVAVYAHSVHDWTDEPTIVLPLAMILGLAQIMWGGAGAFSTDLAATS